ncbi:MAG: hypothetical protein EH225_13520 [Calditrichaeota bacterium]|nr:MAG: hypothetical protein EH225_13520 [Calditrichota bacterium]
MNINSIPFPVKYQSSQPVFIVSVKSGTSEIFARWMSSFLRINFETCFLTLLPVYKKTLIGDDHEVSGSDQILIQHIQENPCFKKWKKQFAKSLDGLGSDNIPSEEGFGNIMNRFYEILNQHLRTVRWGEILPALTPHVTLIHRLYPKAHWIHLLHDGRSLADSFFRKNRFSRNIRDFARFWKYQEFHISEKLKLLPAEQVLKVKSEALFNDNGTRLDELLNFLQLDDPGFQMKRFLMNNRHKIVPEGGKWKTLTCDDILDFEQEAGELLEEYGYKLSPANDLHLIYPARFHKY